MEVITYMVQIVLGEADKCVEDVQAKLAALGEACRNGGVEHSITEARDRISDPARPFGRRPIS